MIEDLLTDYLPEFGGSSGSVAGPDTSLGLVKGLLDDIHHQEHEQPSDGERSLTQRTVTGVHVHHNVVFVEKGTNGEEGGFPAWLRSLLDTHT